MAASYDESSQKRNWLFSREELSNLRNQGQLDDGDLYQALPLPDWRLLSAFFRDQLMKLVKRLNLRQQALATAQVYLKRFYARVEIRKTNPYLVLTTALYVACKMEETPQHIRIVVAEARAFWPEFIQNDVAKIGACEFWLISELSAQMVVHHPYRILLELQSSATITLAQDENALAWGVINDHYNTDLPLMYPPETIAATAIFMALALKQEPGAAATALQIAETVAAALKSQSKGTSHVPSLASQIGRLKHFLIWLAASEIDLKAVADCSQEIISLYAVLEAYQDKAVKEQVTKVARSKHGEE